MAIGETTTIKSKITVPMAAADLGQDDLDAVIEAMRSGRLTMGPKTEEFERAIASYCGARHGIAVNSGTAGLHLLAVAANLQPGDEVVTSSFSFVSSTNCILYLGAVPVFVDIDPTTYCINPELIQRSITRRTKAILAVDVFGHPAQWDRILQVARENGLAVIADACESLGAEYRGCKTGPYGLGGAFAFFPNKQMTTGEGGMIVTNDDEIARICRSLRNQGRGESDAWLSHVRLGYNYRMTEMSAALGISQLHKLEAFIDKRRRVAEVYNALLADEPRVRPLRPQSDVRVSYFVYVVELTGDANRDEVMRRLEAHGVPSRSYFSPIHQQPYIARLLAAPCSLPVTERIGGKTLALPFHNNLSQNEAAFIVSELKAVLDELP